jgi:hypothetical protein
MIQGVGVTAPGHSVFSEGHQPTTSKSLYQSHPKSQLASAKWFSTGYVRGSQSPSAP